MSNQTFTTSKAAEKLGVAPSTLRYWESELSNIVQINRDENGYRQYTSDDLEQLSEIKNYLYEQNYTIKQVRQIYNLEESKQDIAATLSLEDDEQIESLVSILIDKLDVIEDGIDDIKEGQSNLKEEYVKSIKLLNITSERRDKKLIKEIRKRLSEKEKDNDNFLKKLLPWKGN